jgi:hypothetical protein
MARVTAERVRRCDTFCSEVVALIRDQKEGREGYDALAAHARMFIMDNCDSDEDRVLGEALYSLPSTTGDPIEGLYLHDPAFGPGEHRISCVRAYDWTPADVSGLMDAAALDTLREMLVYLPDFVARSRTKRAQLEAVERLEAFAGEYVELQGLGESVPIGDKTLPDGPHPPNRFVWRNSEFRLSPKPWGVVNCLWDPKTRTRHADEVAVAVWDDEEKVGKALTDAISKANNAFLEHHVPIEVCRKGGFVNLIISE